MTLNPVIEMLGRRLRLALIGGGPGSFIGETHRQAARFDNRYEIVAGVLSSNPEKAKRVGQEIGLAPDRAYGSVQEMLTSEASRQDGADVVAIMTPNDSHYLYASSSLAHGFDVICDKPMTNTVEEAQALHDQVIDSGLIFCMTHNYTGYPLVRQAKAMVDDGRLGMIRLIQVEYVQGGKANENDPAPSESWHFDPKRGGPSSVLGEIGCHAHHLMRFVSGLEVEAVSAETGAVVPGRIVDDYAGALLHLNNGGRGSFWVTQAAAGVENGLRIRVSGTKGSLEWMQEHPQLLRFKPLNEPAQNITPNGPGTYPLAKRASRIVAGHPEGFHTAFANIYSDAAEAIAARRSGKQADPLSLVFPNSLDGLLGLKFIDSMIQSSRDKGKWTRC
jgi:predicted dehydrogenase